MRLVYIVYTVFVKCIFRSSWHKIHTWLYLVSFSHSSQKGTTHHNCYLRFWVADALICVFSLVSFVTAYNKENIYILYEYKVYNITLRRHRIFKDSWSVASLRRGRWKMRDSPQPRVSRPSESSYMYKVYTDQSTNHTFSTKRHTIYTLKCVCSI